MASTTFVDQSTVIVASWLNDVNTATYTTTPANTSAIATKAEAGANSTITSLSGLTTALSIAQGGTASTTAAAARTALGTAASGLATASGLTQSTNTILGRSTASTGAIEEISVGAGLSLSAGTLSATAVSIPPPTVRQTVLSGPLDSNGFSAFGGSTGSTTVTATGTIIATAANGYNNNRDGTIVNPSWTGLTASAYLYLDIAANGTCTTGSTPLLPTYRWSGTDVVTSGQFTFNIQEMQGKVGNGSTAAQTYRVFVGEVVASGTVSAITWYALMGRYTSATTATLPAGSVTTSVNHNIGIKPKTKRFVAICTTIDLGCAVGDEITEFGYRNASASVQAPIPVVVSRLSMSLSTGNDANFMTAGKSTVVASVAPANWSYRFEAERGW